MSRLTKALIDFLLSGCDGVNNDSDFESFAKKILSLHRDLWLNRGEIVLAVNRLGEACQTEGMVDASVSDKEGIVSAGLRTFNSGASDFLVAESGAFSRSRVRIDCGFGRGDIDTLRNLGDRGDAETVLLLALVGAMDNVVVIVVVVLVVVMAGTGLAFAVVLGGNGGGASFGGATADAGMAGSGRRGELGGKDMKAPGNNERISLPESGSGQMNAMTSSIRVEVFAFRKDASSVGNEVLLTVRLT